MRPFHAGSAPFALAMVGVFAVANSFGCSKKEQPKLDPPKPTTSAPVASSAPVAASVASTATPLPSSSTAPIAVAIKGEFTFPTELTLDEGKPIVLPAFEKAGGKSEMRKEHDETLKRVHESDLESHSKLANSFSMSFVPSTYRYTIRKAVLLPKSTEVAVQGVHEMTFIEGRNVKTVTLLSEDVETPAMPYAPMNSSRGYLHDFFNDGSVVYVMSRVIAPPMVTDQRHINECLARKWKSVSGEPSVTEATVVPFPTRIRDVDGDGKSDFPGAVFEFVAPSGHFVDLSLDETCGVSDALTISVVGVNTFDSATPPALTFAGSGFRKFYERHLKIEQERANRQRVAIGLTKLSWDDTTKSSDGKPPAEILRAIRDKDKDRLVFNNQCALDVAQSATSIAVYSLLLGAPKEKALRFAEAAMSGLELRPIYCVGLAGGASSDIWPDMLKALSSWDPPKLKDAEIAPVPSSSASSPSAAVSASASAAKP